MNENDAVLVLKKLGYKKKEITSALKNINLDLSVNEIIKLALKVLSNDIIIERTNQSINSNYVFKPVVAQTFHWMMNSYAKHTELTEEDLKWYFDNKKKGQVNAIN